MRCRPIIFSSKVTHRFSAPVLILSLFLVPVRGQAQGFPCDGAFYFASTNQEGESRFYRLQMKEADRSFEVEEIPLISDRKRHLTCLGYNVKDRMIYGLDFNSYELLRIDQEGNLNSLGVPENLDTSFLYYAGDMTADGRRLVVIARNPVTGLDERVYSIQVNDPPRYYAGFFPVVSDVPVAMSDISVDPLVGVTYGFDYLGGQLVETSRNGSTTAHHSPFPIDKVSEGFGALFFGRSGQLYGLASPGRPGGEQNSLYMINKSRGGTEKIGTAAGGADTDGCGCPFMIEFYKEISPAEIVGCQEVRIDYVINNHAGIGQVYTRVEDMLPEIMQIKELQMENLFTVEVKSGVGSNHLDVDEWTLVLGENRLTVIADVEYAEPGAYGSQAQLINLPRAFNEKVTSDDPHTALPNDPTRFSIVDVDNLELETFATASCDLDTIFLSLPLEGNFHWDNGSEGPTLAVVEAGQYSVTVESACFHYTDTILVNFDAAPLSVDLGPDLNLKLGDELSLEFQTNASQPHLIEWSGTGSIHLTCLDCLSPNLSATGDGTVFIRITDSRGCQVEDAVAISVDGQKKIFIPDVFTPNGDGINDRLQIYGTKGVAKSFKIFDRWGRLVRDQGMIDLDDPAFGWDGADAPPGVYIWIAEILFPDQVTQRYSGTITLIR